MVSSVRFRSGTTECVNLLSQQGSGIGHGQLGLGMFGCGSLRCGGFSYGSEPLNGFICGSIPQQGDKVRLVWSS